MNALEPTTAVPAPRLRPMLGVRNPRRLMAVAKAELHGHLGDPDLDAVVATLRLACDVPIAVINIVTANLQTYPAEVGVGAPCTTVPDGLSFCAEVVESGAALLVADASAHPVYARNPMVLDGVIGSYAGVPLIDDGVVLGSVSIFDGTARAFSPAVLEILEHQAKLASSVLALRRSTRTDPLTGLANRRRFADRLSYALARLQRHPGAVAVSYLDIDGFKAINDDLGHGVGDKVLIELAARLGAVMRPTDTLARFGGDEFVAVCGDLTTEADADEMAARMLEVTTGLWVVDGHALEVEISVGVAACSAADTDPEALLRAADRAMYAAKGFAGAKWVRA